MSILHSGATMVAGYTCVVSEHIGEYTEDQAAQLNDGIYVIAVPVDAVKRLGQLWITLERTGTL